jgi:hypothetical protein
VAQALLNLFLVKTTVVRRTPVSPAADPVDSRMLVCLPGGLPVRLPRFTLSFWCYETGATVVLDRAESVSELEDHAREVDKQRLCRRPFHPVIDQTDRPGDGRLVALSG